MSDASPTFRAVAADFAAFLRRPRVLEPAGLFAKGQGKPWLFLTLIEAGVLFALVLPFVHIWQTSFDLAAPSAFDDVPAHWLLPIVVLVAPLAEELLFRGWQNGTRSALWLLACALAIVGAMFLAVVPGQAMLALVLVAAAALAGLIGWPLLRGKREPMNWFARAFPVTFFLVSAIFALVHLSNYDKVSLLAVPLVLPQLWAGLVLGYIRQRIGLVGSITTHALSNGLAMALALLIG